MPGSFAVAQDRLQFDHLKSMEGSLKSWIKNYWMLFGVAAVMIALDQWTKYLVRSTIPFGGSWMPWEWLAPYARIVHWTNNGVAFGMFQGFGMIFALLALIVAGAIVYYYPQIPADQWVMRIALGMQLGGALGNLIDRVLFNFEVTDFISVGTFAVFNIADASISVGVAILLIAIWVSDSKKKPQIESEDSAPIDSELDPSEESSNRDN